MKDISGNTLQVIRFEKDGPSGLKPMDLAPYKFQVRPNAQNLQNWA